MKLIYLKKFGIYLKDNIKELITVLILTGINQICCLLLPTFMSKLIDVGIKQNGLEDVNLKLENPNEIIKIQNIYILKIGLLMLFFALMSLFITICIYKIMSKISSKISMQLRKDLFSKIVNFSYAQKNEFSVSYLITCLSSDIEHVQSFIIMCTQLVVPPLILFGGVAMSLKICFPLTWIIVAGGLVAGGIAFSCLYIVTSKANRLQETQDEFNLNILSQLQGIMIIRGFNNIRFEENKFKKSNLKSTEISLFINKVTTVMSPLLTIASNFLTVLIIWLSALRVKNEVMKVGEVVAFMQYTVMIAGAFVIISLMISTIPQSLVSIKRILKILDCKEKNEKHLKELPDKFRGKISFKNVYFKYNNLSKYSLKDINFEIDYGKTLGIIGTVGSGKTTLLKLILGFYTPQKGQVLFENENLENLKKSSIIKNISYVSQKDSLFSGSIRSNLNFSEIDENKVKEILKIVDLEKFVKENSINFSLVNAGKNISGGQKQRLTLARALLRESSIYIFDDAFSNLDFKTEFSVRNAILNKLKGKTVILVSQRIGTIKNADKIIVMDNGFIVDQGRHSDLIKTCEIYKKMVFMQECVEVQDGK